MARLSLLPLLLATSCVYRVYVEDRTIQLDQDFDTARIDIDAGDVEVYPSTTTAPRIEVTYLYHRDVPVLDLAVDGKTLFVDGRCPALATRCATDLVVYLPAWVDLRVETGAGDLAATDLDGEVVLDSGAGDLLLADLVGPVTLYTGAGRVVGSTLGSQRLDAETGAGRIDLTWIDAPLAVDLRTGAGDIDLLVPIGAYAIAADTGAGEVAIHGLTVSDEAPRTIEADTGAGDITIRGWDPAP